jgi:hypothetical protein
MNLPDALQESFQPQIGSAWIGANRHGSSHGHRQGHRPRLGSGLTGV